MTVTSSVFCSIKHVFISISSGSVNSSKRTKNVLLSCHSCNSCAIRTRCSTHHRFRLINVLHRFVGAECSTGHSMLSKTTCRFFVMSNICRRKQELQLKIFAKNHLISFWIYCFYMWFVFMFKCIDLYFLLTIIVKC